MKTGIFGGSFDPPHSGHQRALDAFIKKCAPDRVLVIPTFISPHKEPSRLRASYEDRCEMSRLAFEREGVTVSEAERELFYINGKKSYTALTLRHIMEEDEELILFVGSDMFLTLDSWYDSKWLFDNTVIAVMRRDESGIEEKKKEYEASFGAKIITVDSPYIEVSSTEVRDSGSGELLSPEVRAYVREKGLYARKLSREEIAALVKSRLPEKRFLHTLSVEKTALDIASRICPHKADSVSAAALLHDVTKPYTTKEHISAAAEAGLALTEDDINSPETLHALTGALTAASLGESPEVADMIASHTTGRVGMSEEQMIIFLADYIEETRTHTACIEERERFYKSFDQASTYSERLRALKDSVCRVLGSTVSYLEGKKAFIHPDTHKALRWLLNNEE